MRNILIIINREFLIFFRNIISNLFIFFLFPILIYLFLVIPFSNLFDLTKGLIRLSDEFSINAPGIHYLYYAIPSLLLICTSMLAFIFPLFIILRDRYETKYLHYMCTSKLTYSGYFLSIIISSILISYIQFIIAFFISAQLSNIVFVNWGQIFYFFIIIFPSILFFSTLGLLISNFIKNYQGILISSIFLFLFLAFGSFTFIPIDYFSDHLNYISFTKSYNLIYHIYDMFIAIFENKNLGLKGFIVPIFISIIFYILNLIIHSKNNKGL